MVDTPQTTTTVEASGTLPSGDVITQAVPVLHQIGTAPGHIMVGAFNIIRQLGGLTFDSSDGGFDFYPLSAFTGRIHFVIKSIHLASLSEMPKERIH